MVDKEKSDGGDTVVAQTPMRTFIIGYPCKLHVILGPMGAGKTKKLESNAQKMAFKGKRVLCVGSILDLERQRERRKMMEKEEADQTCSPHKAQSKNRKLGKSCSGISLNFTSDPNEDSSSYSSSSEDNDKCIETHQGERIPAIMTSSLMEIVATSEYREAEEIMIDEGQFFSDLHKFVNHARNVDFKNITVAALNADSERKAFSEIAKIVPESTRLEMRYGRCSFCNHKATHTIYLGEKTSQLQVGGTDGVSGYKPVCYYHSIVDQKDLPPLRVYKGKIIRPSSVNL